jgi:small-conductance mechanosensitive channel
LAQAAVLKEPPPEVLFDDFGADACVLRLQYWIALHGERGGAAVDSDLRYAIQDAFGAAGIEMPVPRRTVLRDAAQPMHVEPAERNAAPRGTPG